MTFALHPDFKDWLPVCDLAICRVLLNVRYSQYPWLVLIPRRADCRDLTDVPQEDYLPVMEEVRLVHDKLRALTCADKMNVAALGNMTPQLHIHIIARFKTDPAWPKPLWSNEGEPRPYADGGAALMRALQEGLRLRPAAL